MLKLFNKIATSIKKNKIKIFSLIILATLLLLTPTQSVRADFWRDLANLVKGIINLPINIALIIGVSLMLTPLIMNAIGCFLIYVITVVLSRMMILYALNTPISPSSNDAINTIRVIYSSWNFTLGFVNMFFALTLTFIGLATILGLKNYEAKKLLPKLLIIAILVNFTPVIIGFIVDMGNLVTNFFVSKAGIDTGNTGDFLDGLWDTFETTLSLTAIGNFYASLGGLLFSSFTIILGRAIEVTGGIIIGIVFLLYSAYIYICITSMFFLRTIMLWILTILSPIAFFSYIFPPGSPFKKLFAGILSWEEWWDEFLKWVVVGIPFGLFLYISNAIFLSSGIPAPDSFLPPKPVGRDFLGLNFSSLLTSLTTLFTYTVSIMMLYQGYKISMKAAPQMARAMIENTQKMVKTAVMAVATMGVGAVAGAAAGSMGSMASGLGNFSANAASGGIGKRILGKGAGGLSKVMRKGQTRFTQVAIKNKPKTIEGFGDMNTGQQLDATKGIVNKRAKAEHYGKVDWSKVSKEDKDKMIPEIEGMMENKNLRSEYGDTFKKMSKAGISSEKIRLGLSDNPEEAKEEIDNKVEEIKDNISKDEKLEKEIEIKIKYVEDAGGNKEQFMRDLAAQTLNFEELKPGDLKDLGKDNITSLPARLGSHKLSGNSLRNIRNNYGDATANDLFNEAGGIGNADLETLYQENPDLVRHLTTNEYGKTWEWEAALQLDEKYKHEGDGKEKGNADWKKIKAHMTTISSKTPMETAVTDTEIDALAKKIGKERSERKSDNSYQFNGKFVDRLLEDAEVAKETPQAKAFIKNWDKAEAIRQLVQKRKNTLKETDSTLKKAEAIVNTKEAKKTIKTNMNSAKQVLGPNAFKKLEKKREGYKKIQQGIESIKGPDGIKTLLDSAVKAFKNEKIEVQNIKKKIEETKQQMKEFDKETIEYKNLNAQLETKEKKYNEIIKETKGIRKDIEINYKNLKARQIELKHTLEKEQ